MTLNDGTHISWWPAPGISASYKNGWKDLPGEENKNLTMDILSEGKNYDYLKSINFLDEKSIKEWWNNFKSIKIYNGLTRNCSTAVAKGLMAGGASKYYLYTDRLNFIWTPNDIKAYVDGLIEAKELIDTIKGFF